MHMREYNKRLIIVIILVVSAFIGVRTIVVPESFGEYGWYRGESPGEIAARPLFYATSADCEGCHPRDQRWEEGLHRNLNCETCMGPGKKHVEDPKTYKIEFDTSRKFCGLCHAKNPSRPKTQPQIDMDTHNPGRLCITCHKPHSPRIVMLTPPETPSNLSGAALFNDTCSKCHVDALLFGDLSKSKQEWREGVEKMNDMFSLGLNEEQIDSLSSYLKNTYGG